MRGYVNSLTKAGASSESRTKENRAENYSENHLNKKIKTYLSFFVTLLVDIR
jgi:hypothetical protein